MPGKRFVQHVYPACWWMAADGVNRERLKRSTRLEPLEPMSVPLACWERSRRLGPECRNARLGALLRTDRALSFCTGGRALGTRTRRRWNAGGLDERSWS